MVSAWFLPVVPILRFSLKRVGVIDEHLVEVDVGDIEQAVFLVERQHAGLDHAFGDDIGRFVGGVEDQHVMQSGIGDEEAVAIVHGEADDAHEVGVDSCS